MSIGVYHCRRPKDAYVGNGHDEHFAGAVSISWSLGEGEHEYQYQYENENEWDEFGLYLSIFAVCDKKEHSDRSNESSNRGGMRKKLPTCKRPNCCSAAATSLLLLLLEELQNVTSVPACYVLID